jgi:hypothetical protein
LGDAVLTALRSVAKNSGKFFREVSTFRQKINMLQYPALIAKIRRIRPAGKNGLISARTNYLSKRGLPPPIATISLIQEAAWTAAQLVDYIKPLKKHIYLINEITSYVNDASFDQALAVVNLHLEEFGETLWGIEAKVGVLSLMDSQQLLDEFRESRTKSYGSMPDFLLYVLEDLFDEDTSLGGFQRRMSLRLKGLRSGAIHDFLQARVGLGDTKDTALSGYLRISSWYGVIDAYETLISILPKIFFVEKDQAKFYEILSFLTDLEYVDDIRLSTVISVFKKTGDKDPRTKILKSTYQSHSLLNYKNFPDLDAIAKMAFSPNVSAETAKSLSALEKTIFDAIIPFNEKRTELISTYEQLHTLISKFRFLPWREFAQSWTDGIFLPVAGEFDYLWYRASCRVPTIHTDQRSLVDSLPWAKIYDGHEDESSRYIDINEALLKDNLLPSERTDFFSTQPYSYGKNLASIAVSLRAEDAKTTLTRCVTVAISILGSSSFLPFSTIFAQRTAWEDYDEFDLLDTVIGLYFTSLGDRESRNRFLLEFACKKILGEFKENWAIALIEKYSASDARIIFILRDVLLPKNLRLVGKLNTVEQLERFRIDICSALLDVDKDFSDEYIAETFEILQLQDMRKAERDVESSRINVDREGIKRWAEKTYREEFLHAKKARTIKVAPTLEEIETSFREIAGGEYKLNEINIDANLKDPIFNIGYEVFRKCFWKEDDGLDHFLSLRIRHGSFAGYLRASLEQTKLVGSGTRANDARSVYWRDALKTSTQESVQKYLDALNIFQCEFDLIIEHFRNDLLQINTGAKPQGLFIPGLNKILWDAYHHDWEIAKNFDIFFDRIWESFQTALEGSLAGVSEAIDVKITSNCEQLLVELRRLVSTSGLSSTDRATVISAVNEGGRGLQEATRSVKKWFEVARDPVSETRLNARQVLELATKLFKRIRPSFIIDFSPVSVPAPNIYFSRSNINRVTDALFIIFDNVYKHSGFDSGAEVDLIFEWIKDSEATGKVHISATSEISPDRSISDVRKRIEEVRIIMESGEHRNALVSEGRSGLIKLAWLATTSSQPGEINFSVSDDYRFNVEVWMNFGFTGGESEDVNASFTGRG